MILNFGSINLDLVYRVAHLPKPGETLASTSFARFLGGKGINQSIAAARSGGAIRHIGCLGPDGKWLGEQIAHFGLSLDEITQVDVPTGHAVIFVDDTAENQIVLFGGSNLAFTKNQIEQALNTARRGDWVLLQNETNLVSYIAQEARARGLKVAYSAAPFDANAVRDLLDQINLLALNEGEAAAIAQNIGHHPAELNIDHVLITKGERGAELHSGGEILHQDSVKVEAIDTTGAGDTFLGAFMARFVDGKADEALAFAAGAAALQVTKQGAAAAIPCAEEVEAFLRNA
ncbi:ribokinase [uncultured Roseovarius sp.]|uniref:ribokinase n=1 Tax=uncultured Roseovarius sp. TaxID=293344 RepID=UPI002619A09F|nr:ribokinase [uncultured Roseovarius sp.]